MAGFGVNVSLDIDTFEAKLSDWSKNLPRANNLGAEDAADFIKEIVQEKLMMFPHPPGTPTPAPPITGPVGFITGHLHDSVEVRGAGLISGWAKVGVSSVYARIQEIGGWTGTHRSSYLPPRPYFRTSIEEDEVGRIFYWRWKEAMEEAMSGAPASPMAGLSGTEFFYGATSKILSAIGSFKF